MTNAAVETTLLRIESLRAELAAQPETTAECCALRGAEIMDYACIDRDGTYGSEGARVWHVYPTPEAAVARARGEFKAVRLRGAEVGDRLLPVDARRAPELRVFEARVLVEDARGQWRPSTDQRHFRTVAAVSEDEARNRARKLGEWDMFARVELTEVAS